MVLEVDGGEEPLGGEAAKVPQPLDSSMGSGIGSASSWATPLGVKEGEEAKGRRPSPEGLGIAVPPLLVSSMGSGGGTYADRGGSMSDGVLQLVAICV